MDVCDRSHRDFQRVLLVDVVVTSVQKLWEDQSAADRALDRHIGATSTVGTTFVAAAFVIDTKVTFA